MQTERAQQEDLYQSSSNLPVRSFLAPLHVMNHKGSQHQKGSDTITLRSGMDQTLLSFIDQERWLVCILLSCSVDADNWVGEFECISWIVARKCSYYRFIMIDSVLKLNITTGFLLQEFPTFHGYCSFSSTSTWTISA